MEKWKENLKKAALEMVSCACSAMSWELILWDNSQTRILNCLLQAGIISREEISTATDKGIRYSGRASFIEHVRSEFSDIGEVSLDQTRSPEAFAYALSKGEFILEEEEGIRFDRGEDKEAFIKSYCEDADVFLERMVERILTEQSPLPPATEEGSRADGCSDGPCCYDPH